MCVCCGGGGGISWDVGGEGGKWMDGGMVKSRVQGRHLKSGFQTVLLGQLKPTIYKVLTCKKENSKKWLSTVCLNIHLANQLLQGEFMGKGG